MRVRLLGPVDVVVDGASRPIQGLRRKAMLATLALHDGEIVGTDRLVDVIWGEAGLAGRRCPRCKATCRSCAACWAAGRRSGPVRPVTCWSWAAAIRTCGRPSGCCGRARSHPTRSTASGDLEAALALWRGRPLADVAGLTWLEEQAQRLDLLLGQVKRGLVEARMALGSMRG